tara:strand:+ start:632 stop:739 length:108 start_codon:yes stop_codon:yes gene_type:complete
MNPFIIYRQVNDTLDGKCIAHFAMMGRMGAWMDGK